MCTCRPGVVSTDVLVIGGGGAGLRAAIEARERGARVTLVSQSRVGYASNTAISGAAFAVAPASGGAADDSPEQHLRDTVVGGCYLNDQSLVNAMVRDAERQKEALHRFGVSYASPSDSPWIDLCFDPGHSRNRLVYCRTPLGTDFTFPMRNYALRQGVDFAEGVLATRLLKHRESVVGAVCMDMRGEVFVIGAPATIIATGGGGQAYSRTDNTSGSTGDGYALAYEAGAVLQDMEFVQTYPLSLGSGTPALFYECLLPKSGGRLLNGKGEDIPMKHGLTDPMLLTRDRLSQAIAAEVECGLGAEGKVILDLAGIPAKKLKMLQPVLPKAALRGQRQFWVAPTVHFTMGGIRIDERTGTTVPGLYAAGEVAAGVHGANRLSGNALTELWVFGAIAGREAAALAEDSGRSPTPEDAVAAEAARLDAFPQEGQPIAELRRRIKNEMWQHAGIIRNGKGLESAIDRIADLEERARSAAVAGPRDVRDAVKTFSMLKVSEMICRAALHRRESRGAHYRSDLPERDDRQWLCNVLVTGEGERMVLTTEPVKMSLVSP